MDWNDLHTSSSISVTSAWLTSILVVVFMYSRYSSRFIWFSDKIKLYLYADCCLIGGRLSGISCRLAFAQLTLMINLDGCLVQLQPYVHWSTIPHTSWSTGTDIIFCPRYSSGSEQNMLSSWRYLEKNLASRKKVNSWQSHIIRE